MLGLIFFVFHGVCLSATTPGGELPRPHQSVTPEEWELNNPQNHQPNPNYHEMVQPLNLFGYKERKEELTPAANPQRDKRELLLSRQIKLLQASNTAKINQLFDQFTRDQFTHHSPTSSVNEPIQRSEFPELKQQPELRTPKNMKQIEMKRQIAALNSIEFDQWVTEQMQKEKSPASPFYGVRKLLDGLKDQRLSVMSNGEFYGYLNEIKREFELAYNNQNNTPLNPSNQQQVRYNSPPHPPQQQNVQYNSPPHPPQQQKQQHVRYETPFNTPYPPRQDRYETPLKSALQRPRSALKNNNNEQTPISANKMPRNNNNEQRPRSAYKMPRNNNGQPRTPGQNTRVPGSNVMAERWDREQLVNDALKSKSFLTFLNYFCETYPDKEPCTRGRTRAGNMYQGKNEAINAALSSAEFRKVVDDFFDSCFVP